MMAKASIKYRDIRLADRGFYWTLRFLAVGLIALLCAIVVMLAIFSWPALQTFGLQFFTQKEWNPVTESFGVLAFVYGTLVSSLIALLLACPISIGTSLFLTEIAPRTLAKMVGFLVEMLAAIPSVVYGLWGIFVLAPVLRSSVEPWLADHLGFLPFFQGPPYGVGMLTAGIVLAIMIIPTIAAITREVFLKIPIHEREAALALGSTRWEMMYLAVLKSSFSGIVGAIILGLGRALGETMAVTMVIGNRADISLSLFEPAQTMASVIANEYTEASSDLHLSSLVAVGLVLFLISLITNAFARVLVWRVSSKQGRR